MWTHLPTSAYSQGREVLTAAPALSEDLGLSPTLSMIGTPKASSCRGCGQEI